MAIYSIGDLSKLSGIKTPTLRMWEQRYGILNPKRTERNLRYYDDEDVRHLLNVALLNRNGLKISKIAKLTRSQITMKVAELSEIQDEFSKQLDALTLSMLEMNEVRFDRILSVNIEQLGFEQTMMTVIFPFLEKLGVLWMTGSVKPVQEQFTSALIRRKLMVEIENLPHPNQDNTKKLLLFLPVGEIQEMSLLLLHYLARKQGYEVFYLGRDITLNDIEDANSLVKPDFLFTMITETFAQGSARNYAERLLQACPDTKILLSGYQAIAQPMPQDERLIVLRSMDETVHYLKLNFEQAIVHTNQRKIA